MWYLLIVSFVWAFSFGLIKGKVAGLDPTFVAAGRLVLGLLVFVPFWRPRRIGWRLAVGLLGLGSVQFGLMSILYIRAFQHLQAHEVALFTIFTPLLVTLFNAVQCRRLTGLFWGTSLLSTLGTAIIIYQRLASSELLAGFLLVQGSNACFAFGQLQYRRLMAAHPGLHDREVFAYPYLGAAALAVVGTWVLTPLHPLRWTLSGGEWWTIAYLGIVPSGVCFFLWNLGARRVNVGLLAIFNDLKIPLGVCCSLFIFGEYRPAMLGPLVAGSSLIGLALYLNERGRRGVFRQST